jgi:Na+/phosphate symporter
MSLFVGLLLLDSDVLARLHPRGDALMLSLVDWIFNPFLKSLHATLPQWTLFPLGLILIMFSFHFFERCLPNMTIQENRVGGIVRLAYRPMIMFLLGAGITMISMSVSISLSILVPLNNRGVIRRETVIPYIMGANITTFVDTLLASMLISHPAAFSVVMIEMLSVSLVSMFVLFFIYRPYARLHLAIVDHVMRSNRNMCIFMLAIFIVPLFLLLV